MTQLQQGDVLFVESQIPAGAKPVAPRHGRLVLAEGEATGHAHTCEAAPDVELFEKDGTLYLSVKTDTDVTHEEHKTVTVPPGQYEIGIVQEYDYDAKERHSVVD